MPKSFTCFAAVLAGLLLAGLSRAAAPSKPPNILWIMTDQQSADAMSCRMGRQYLHTPAMDSLAKSGMVFTRAYCANPLCVPSRTSMFSGRYPHETGAQTNDDKKIDIDRYPCLGLLFQRGGYDTGYVGKWHLPYTRQDAAQHGFQFMENVKGNGGDSESPAAARAFLERERGGPFFLVVSLVNPHNICEWARGQSLPDGPIGEPPSAEQLPPLRANHETPKGETDIMLLIRQSYQSSPTFPVSGFDDLKWRQYAWAYYRMIEKVDRLIGEVLQAVRERGAERDTLVVMTADHGDCQGAHGWNQKTVLYDEASRVPLIISWPGVTQPGLSDRLVHTGVDLLPTFCDYAGLAIPAGMPGLSLKATANGQTQEDPRTYLVISDKLVQGAPVDGEKPEPEGRMVRSSRYKYCRYNLGQRREQLFDMQADPGELTNLADDPQHQSTLQQHRRYLEEFCRQTHDDFAR